MQLRKQSEDKAKQAKLSPDALPTPSPDDACTISPIESPTISEKKREESPTMLAPASGFVVR